MMVCTAFSSSTWRSARPWRLPSFDLRTRVCTGGAPSSPRTASISFSLTDSGRLSRKTRTLSDCAAVERPRVAEVCDVGDVKGEAREAAKEEEREEKAAAEEDGEAHELATTGRRRRRPRRMIWRVSIASHVTVNSHKLSLAS